MVFLCCATGAHVKTYELSSEAMHLHRAMSSLNAEVTCARYNHNGKIIASCSVDGGICLDVASSGELLSRFFYPATSIAGRRVNTVHFSSGSRFLATGGSDGCVRVWDLKTQEVTQTYSISASAVTSVTFSGYKDDFIVAGSESGAISVCDVQSTETVGFLSVDSKFAVAGVTSVLASPHPYARQIVGSTYADGSVRVWDLHTGQLSAEFANQHDAAATCLAISPVSKVLLVTGGHDRRVLFFDTLQRRELRSMDLDAPVSSLALCADGKTLAVGTTNGDVFVYDLRGAITPLYGSTVGDGGAGGAAAVKCLQFATTSTDTSNATVFPTGQPVIATERTSAGPPSPRKSTLSSNGGFASPPNVPTPPAYDNARQPEVPALFSPPSLSSVGRYSEFAVSTNQTVEPNASQGLSELAILQQLQQQQPRQIPYDQQAPSLLNSFQKSSPTRLGESSPRHAEPSLLSMLAEPSPTRNQIDSAPTFQSKSEPPLPLTSPTSYTAQLSKASTSDRGELEKEVELFQLKLDRHHQERQQDLDQLLQTVLAKYDSLLEETLQLRRENESLRAHMQQQNGSSFR